MYRGAAFAPNATKERISLSTSAAGTFTRFVI